MTLATVTPRGDASVLSKYLDAMKAASVKYDVPMIFIALIIMHESGGKAGAVQPNGLGRGLMQVDVGQNPSYDAGKLTGTDAASIQYQIDSGTKILRQMYDAHGKDWSKALQGYAGPAYRSNDGETFAEELSKHYFGPVVKALLNAGFDASGQWNIGAGLGSAAQGAADIAGEAFKPLADMLKQLSNPETWLRTAMVVLGAVVLIGGFYLIATGDIGNGS